MPLLRVFARALGSADSPVLCGLFIFLLCDFLLGRREGGGWGFWVGGGGGEGLWEGLGRVLLRLHRHCFFGRFRIFWVTSLKYWWSCSLVIGDPDWYGAVLSALYQYYLTHAYLCLFVGVYVLLPDRMLGSIPRLSLICPRTNGFV